MRAKMIDGVFTTPPNPVWDGTTKIHDPSDATLARLGWKLVVDEAQPQTTGETHPEQTKYTETETTIIRGWNIVEDSASLKCSRRRDWFDNDYRKWNEMLTRCQALGITEEITDEFRDKTYTSLTDLYTEAEVVRAEINAMENQNE